MSASGQYAIRIILFHAIFPSLRRLRPPSRAVRRPTRARTQSPKKSASTTHITKFIPLHLRGDALVVEASKLVLIGDLDLLLRPGLRVRDVELRARERSKIIASVVALIHRIAAHPSSPSSSLARHRPRPRIARIHRNVSFEPIDTARASPHRSRARARDARPRPPRAIGATPRVSPRLAPAPVVILPHRAPPRRRPPASRDENARVVPRSHLHDGTLARRVKRRRRQPRARLVSGLARWSPAGCILSPSYFYTLTEHHHGYAHVSNTSLVYITTCPTKSRPHTPRTRTPRRRTRFAKFAKDGRTDAFDWIGFRMASINHSTSRVDGRR